MEKVILAIDSVFPVTNAQHAATRRACIDQGHEPKVVHTTIEELFLDRDALTFKYSDVTVDAIKRARANRASENEDGTLSADDLSQLEDLTREDGEYQLAQKHLKSYGDIFSVVMTEQAYQDWEELVAQRETARQLRESGGMNRWVVNELSDYSEALGWVVPPSTNE